MLYLFGASVVGKRHLEANEPNQDAIAFERIDDQTGICVLSDGAGSEKQSHIGSNLVVQECMLHCKQFLRRQDIKKNYGEKKWQNDGFRILKATFHDLKGYADKKEIPLQNLNCTLIFIIFHSSTLLLGGIGDGRVAARTNKGKWKALFKPASGEQVGMTYFLTDGRINYDKDYKANEKYISLNVFKNKFSVFTLLSDGCEKSVFIPYRKNEEGYVKKTNIPIDNILNRNVEALQSMIENGFTEEEASKELELYLIDGTKQLKNEHDDKSIIYGFKIGENG